MSYMSICNFNSKSDGRLFDFFFHLITTLPFPLQNLVQRLRSQTPSSISSTPSEVSAIPCVLFGNTLRALFLKNRYFFCCGEIFLPITRGPLGCLLGFWPSGPKPCGDNNCLSGLKCSFSKRLTKALVSWKSKTLLECFIRVLEKP